MKRVAYITSGKIGIHRFTLNELVLLEERGIDFDLCLTQLNQGFCMPKKEWNVYTANRIKAIIQFFSFLFGNQNIIKLLIEAKNKKALAYFFMALSIYKDIKNNGITSIHCQMGDDKLYIGYFLKKFMKLPLTVTVHAHELYQRKVYDNNDRVKELYSLCDKVITISEFNAKLINESFGVNNDKISVMRLFPDIDTQNCVVNKTKILIVANWFKKKGYITLLKALKKINRSDVVLWVVGGSSKQDDGSIDLPKIVNDYDMNDKVVILGYQSTPVLDIIFYACDIFCLPSHTDFYSDGKPSEREGIPVALMEAMAWGKPVIATHHAGNSELINQVLVKENDAENLCNAIENLIENNNEWDKMGIENQKIINNKFSKKNIDTLVEILKNI